MKVMRDMSLIWVNIIMIILIIIIMIYMTEYDSGGEG